MTEPGAPPAAIRLLFPAEGSLTAPLQAYPWRGWEDEEWERREREGAWPVRPPEVDAGLPRPVRLVWDAPPGLVGSLRYRVRLTAQDGSGETTELDGLCEPQVEVKNLRIGTIYYWKVEAFLPADPSVLAALSAVGSFRTPPDPPRWIEVPGVTNVRDLGGWPLRGGGRVRQGLFFRGSEMNAHCTITAEGRDLLVDRLGIRSDIDLRGDGEEWGPVLDEQRVAYHHIPVASYDMIANMKYIPLYRELFGLLAKPSTYPLYLHCWGGADRTGTVAFLLGALLGMREEDLRLDYELTSLSIWGERRADSEVMGELVETLALFAADGSSVGTRVERYLRVIGVTGEEIESIRRILTE